MAIKIKSSQQIAHMRQSGQILAQVLAELSAEVAAGVTARSLSDLARQKLEKLDAKSAFLGYQDYPDVLCVSVNDEIVHAIPDETPFKEGDVVSLDFGVNYQGLITDGATTLMVGSSKSADSKRLLNATEAALVAGIRQARAGNRVGDISAAVEKVLRADNLGIIETLNGHGVGLELHESPEVPNFGAAGTGPVLKAGMTIAIEPMATLGGPEVSVDQDGWTIRTSDGSLAAHFEHTVLITEDEPEILTSIINSKYG